MYVASTTCRLARLAGVAKADMQGRIQGMLASQAPPAIARRRSPTEPRLPCKSRAFSFLASAVSTSPSAPSSHMICSGLCSLEAKLREQYIGNARGVPNDPGFNFCSAIRCLSSPKLFAQISDSPSGRSACFSHSEPARRNYTNSSSYSYLPPVVVASVQHIAPIAIVLQRLQRQLNASASTRPEQSNFPSRINIRHRITVRVRIRVDAAREPDRIGLGIPPHPWLVVPMVVVEQPRLRVVVLPGHAQRQHEGIKSGRRLDLRRLVAKRLGHPAPAHPALGVGQHPRRVEVVGVDEEHLLAHARCSARHQRHRRVLQPQVLAKGLAAEVVVFAQQLAPQSVDVLNRTGFRGGLLA